MKRGNDNDSVEGNNAKANKVDENNSNSLLDYSSENDENKGTTSTVNQPPLQQ